MSYYLVIGGWNGRRKVPVNIISETADSFQVEPLERVFVPGIGVLKQGQPAFVSRRVVSADR